MTAALLPTAGYSPRTLPEKLGFKPGMRVLFVGLPEELSALAQGLTAQHGAAWADAAGAAGSLDAVHAFTRAKADLTHLPALRRAIVPNGMIWVSWPKKAAKVQSDVSEDVVRAAALALDLVDVKVAAVDAVWSGLKLVVRKDRR